MVDGSWMLVRIVLIANALLFLPFLGALLAQPNAIFDPKFGIFDLAPAGITKNLRTAFYFYGAEIAGLVVMLLLASGSREAAKVVLAGLTCTGVLTTYACWQAATQLKSFQAGKAEVVSGSFLAMTCINALATWRAYAARPVHIKRE